MRSRLSVGAVFCMLACVLPAGCNDTNELVVEGHELIASPKGTVSVYQLAGRLDLRVIQSSRTHATLRNGAHTVLIFADPEGQILVNGKPVGATGGITPVGDILFIPTAAVQHVRAATRTVQIPAQPPSRRRPGPKRRIVVLDPGHGGRDPGAPSCAGIWEKTVNLSVALSAAEILRRRGINVILTRDNDTFIELNERAAIANRKRAALFVSIHADAAKNRSARGFTMYVSRSASERSLAAARAISRHMVFTGTPNRGIRRADFRVLVRTACPAVLVELGYLSNRQEAARLAKSAHRRKLAESIANGVTDFLR